MMVPPETRRPSSSLLWWTVLGLAGLSSVVYLVVSSQTLRLGFPLDDAWIHQTYARNLALQGEYAFLPGIPSAGSTGPLWTLALSVGHRLGLDPRWWTFALGTVLLALLARACAHWFAIRMPAQPSWMVITGVLVALEWHLGWAALSGMEILAMALLVAGTLLLLDRGSAPPMYLGALVGLGIWIRPDAMLLILPVTWSIVVAENSSTRDRMGSLAAVAVGLGLVVIPYLAFNQAISGNWWPSTFYAKQAEYAILRESSILVRIYEQMKAPLVGVLAVMSPGLLVALARIIRCRKWVHLAPFLWVIAHLGVFALRLPVTYQHGRYVMPTIPVLLVLSAEGMAEWTSPACINPLRRLISRTWVLSTMVVAIVFSAFGARAYGQDVAIIESEMVASAEWVSKNTSPDSLIAAHDIGALGYFSDRRLVDLAGLVSPEVIPHLRDEEYLASLLDRLGVDYLVTFPGWYPDLVSRGDPVFTTGGVFSGRAGGEGMVVYEWP